MLTHPRRGPVRQPLSRRGRHIRNSAYRPRPELLEERCLLTLLPPVAYQPSVAAVSSMAVADFNGDGHPDIVTTDPASGTVSVLLNIGDGTFRAGPSALAGDGATAVVAGDFNGDGKMDVAVANDVAVGTVSVLLGNGNGTFQPAENTGVGSMPDDLKAVDLNGDGTLDLVAADSASNNVITLLGNGDGTFRAPINSFAGNEPAALTVGDFDRDGIPDLLISNVGSGLNLFPGNGDGAFQLPVTLIPTPNGLQDATAGDLNGDGKLDVVFADAQGVDAVLGNGDGTFRPAVQVLADAAVQSVAITDLNGDGIPDLAVRSGTSPSTIEAVLGRGDGTFWPAVSYGTTPGTGPAIAADLNGDGAPDVVATSGTPATGVSVMLNAVDDVANLGGAVGFRVTPLGADTAGAPFSFSVTAVDAAGNAAPGYRGPVDLGSSDPRMTSPAPSYTFTAADAGTHVFTNDMTLFAAGRQTVTAGAPLMAASSGAVTVVPASASRLVFSAPAAIVAGAPTTVTITAFDAFGNLATNYTGTVSETADGTSTLPPTTTFTTADAGVHKVAATFLQAGTFQVTGNDSTNPSIAGSVPIIVVPNLLKAVVVVADKFFPGIGFGPGIGGIAGQISDYTIEPLDAFGNIIAPDPLGFVVTSSDPKAAPQTIHSVLVGQEWFTQVGQEWFTAGLQSITATSIADPSISFTLGNIKVIPGSATTFQITGLAPTTTAGVTQTLGVTALDPFGNVDPLFFGSVDLSSSDPRAQFPFFATFTAAQAGHTTIQVTLDTAGPQFIAATATAGSPFLIAPDVTTVVPAAVSNFVVSGFPSTTAGVTQFFTVTAFDALGNVATNYTGTVVFSSSDVRAGLPASYTFTAANAGSHTFAATLKTSGSQSIAVADAANPSANGAESGIAVQAGAATHFVITGSPSETAGKAFVLVITAVDAFGNVATGYRGKVHITDTAGTSGLPSDFSFSAGAAGVVSLSFTLNTVSVQTLAVADVASPTINGSIAVTVAQKPSGGGGGGGGKAA